ncbi:type III secretion system needle length determinant, SpaN/EivJ family [Chromobacterium sp. IIBBL 290-4]|uniref:SpaN/EivJ family type III secretion system needle length determinant n=1 Tax=Chromobacterium sp. IIBBL 290-4 TaxID=2953890 RepID=UPI0020B74C69|nr:type III secretion system needle length determinant, SpaN/EivJ family [Chromobacterium sp. IIBBL 290-4]UTH74104.1 hypothetical protein NKT35_21580 [Chromobacterium sp. IIBBL 290-4]
MGIVMPGAGHGRAASLGEDADGVVALERIAKSKAERGKKRLDSAAEEACAWLAYAPPIRYLAEAPRVAESFAMPAEPPSGAASTRAADAFPEAETSVDRSNVESQAPTAQLNAAAASAALGLGNVGGPSPRLPGVTTRAALHAAIPAAVTAPRQLKPAQAGAQAQERRGIASVKSASHVAPLERLGVSLSPSPLLDPPAHPLGAKNAIRSSPLHAHAVGTGGLPRRTAQPQPQSGHAQPVRAGSVVPADHRAQGAALDQHASNPPSAKSIAAHFADLQRGHETIGRAESLADVPGGMARQPELKHVARAGLHQSKREAESIAPHAPAPARSAIHYAEAELAPAVALSVQAETNADTRQPEVAPTRGASAVAAVMREPAAGDVSSALNLPAPLPPVLPGEAGAFQGSVLKLFAESAEQSPRGLTREAGLIPETRGADAPSRKSERAHELEPGGFEAGVWGPRPALSRGSKSEAPQSPAAKKLPPQSRQAAEPDKSPSGMNFRFQSWGEEHAVKITAENSPSGWQLQLQPSDSLVSQRLSEQWASGDPQQWRLLQGEGEGRRDAPPRQGETEEDE